MVNTWKVIAIVFIIITIVETIFVATLFRTGLDSNGKELRCIDKCTGAESYTFDVYTNECGCYNGDKLLWKGTIS